MASAPDLDGVEMILAEGQTGTTKFDLTLGLTEVQGQVLGVFEYATDLFEPATVERLAEHFRVLLEGIVAGPRRRLSRSSSGPIGSGTSSATPSPDPSKGWRKLEARAISRNSRKSSSGSGWLNRSSKSAVMASGVRVACSSNSS